ncbi:hypothetical protein PR202_ga03899 [Eleusine coracana subsp. coracana]|uniref:GATA-type domain-containing protein n=1 Tax=Eleusine coracana subsp. coracana TaxID=191504 RepID=A0AAV5BNL5_ELECO|nr:hypothetical protein PR202_ga03899 [Eleusine coracana subsp. coracana]
MSAAAAADGVAGEEEKGPHLYVLALPLSLPLPVAVARIDAGVPRRARTSRAHAKPAGWWAFRLPVPLPKAPAASSPEKEGKTQRLSVCLGLGAPSLSPAADLEEGEERPAKKARRCVQCGSAETPQWRSGPMGRSTLCNACGVRLRAAGALREAVELHPPPATPPPPPESPGSDSDSPICQRRVPLGDVYLVRKNPVRERRTPRKDSSSPPRASSSSSPPSAIYLVRKKKPSKKPWRPRNTGQRCLHCGTTSTPQWREGPMGRHTLCNACGVRYRQGRLLPEYRPAASPTFVPSEHASRHREVVQLHRQRQGGSTKTQQLRRKQQLPLPPTNNKLPVDDHSLLFAQCGGDSNSDEDDKNNVFLVRRERPADKEERYPATPLHRPLLPPPVDDDPRGGNKGAVAGNDQTEALDSLLLEGPSAPLIVDGADQFLVS